MLPEYRYTRGVYIVYRSGICQVQVRAPGEHLVRRTQPPSAKVKIWGVVGQLRTEGPKNARFCFFCPASRPFERSGLIGFVPYTRGAQYHILQLQSTIRPHQNAHTRTYIQPHWRLLRLILIVAGMGQVRACARIMPTQTFACVSACTPAPRSALILRYVPAVLHSPS